jgi:azurin
MKKSVLLTAFAVSFFLAACGDNKNKKEDTAAPAEESPAQYSNIVELEANDQMKFDKTEINVKAGEKVTLSLKNVGSMPKVSMAHNFVLLKDGTVLETFAKEADLAPDHIPANDPAIIAHTKLLGPGESDTIEFTVPAGDYTYICSFPSHYKTMVGILTAH